MNFLYPIGFVALAGLIIPVIVHLWSVKQGKTLKIGSISLLGESASASSKNLNLSDWPLFILRCLLLVLLAFLLAQPHFKQTATAKKRAGWILLEQQELKNIYGKNHKTMDSLLALGFELHNLNLGFEKIALADTLSSYQAREISYTSLLKELATVIPNHYEVIIFANRQLKNFDGDLPIINFKLTWKTVSTTDTLKNWKTNFVGKSYSATSSPSSTSYQVDPNPSKPTLAVLLHYSNANDRKYLNAAIMAIAEFTNRKITVTNWKPGINHQADAGFWLTDQSIDPNFKVGLKKNANLFSYQKGKVLASNSTLKLTLSAPADANITLHKRIVPASYKGSTVWTDGFGNPILSLEKSDKLNFYHFYTQLNPQWTDLVWSDQFVKALIPIVIGNQEASDFGFEDHKLDQRQLSAQQNEAVYSNGTAEVASTQTNEPLINFCWLIALLILLAERLLSFRKKQAADVKN